MKNHKLSNEQSIADTGQSSPKLRQWRPALCAFLAMTTVVVLAGCAGHGNFGGTYGSPGYRSGGYYGYPGYYGGYYGGGYGIQHGFGRSAFGYGSGGGGNGQGGDGGHGPGGGGHEH